MALPSFYFMFFNTIRFNLSTRKGLTRLNRNCVFIRAGFAAGKTGKRAEQNFLLVVREKFAERNNTMANVKTTKTNTSKKTNTVAKKAQTKVSTKAVSKTKETVEQVVREVALKINKEFSGINLFFVDRKFYTPDDKVFFSENKMHWHKTGKYWFVKLRDKDQVVRVINHFQDRLDVPSDIDSQVAEVLGDMPSNKTEVKASKTSKSKTTRRTAAVVCPF